MTFKIYKIVENAKLWFSLSLSIMVIGLVFIIARGFNMGIDFTGGAMLQVDLHKQISVEEVQETLKPFKLDADVVHIGTEKQEVMIKSSKALDNTQRKEVFTALAKKYSLKNEDLKGSELVGPTIGKEITSKALLAIAIASVGMLIYITLRFEFIYGVSAIIALLHDVFILVSLYAIFYIPVNSPFIAAILTIVGYSINDTIVVFDRVRENVAVRKKETHAQIANASISSTLARSINTSLTTVVVIGGLYVFGVESVKVFALPLMAGITIGTFSSIFIASPIWAIWKDAEEKKLGHNQSA